MTSFGRVFKLRVKGVAQAAKSASQLLRNPQFRGKSHYAAYRERLPLDPKAVLLESQHGKGFNGNIYYMLRYMALSPEYAGYRFYLSAWGQAKRQAYEKRILEMGLSNVQVVVNGTKAYYQAVATAKYLINDTTFLPFFHKREGQIYLNTWHGTPLKTLGKDIIDDPLSLSNVQKNFFSADYLFSPNEYTAEILIRSFMLSNFSRGQSLRGGGVSEERGLF